MSRSILGTPVAAVVLALCVSGCRERSAHGATAGREDAAAPEDAVVAAAAEPARDAGVVETALAPSPAVAPSADCVAPRVTKACRHGFCTIPAGCFILGTPRAAKSATAYSDQEVEVRLTHSFALAQTEVTRADWLAAGFPEPHRDWRVTGSEHADTPPAGYEQCLDAQCPVVWLSFEDAAAYANRRSLLAGFKPCYVLSGCLRGPGENMRCASVKVDAASPYECEGYRLPSEAEWEYAARAGTRTDYSSGDMAPESSQDSDCNLDPNLDRIAWYCGNAGAPAGAKGGGRAHPVAQKQANKFGLHDMAGNAYEWVNDRFTPAGYGTGPLRDPIFGVADTSDLTSAKDIFAGDPSGLAEDGLPGFRVRRGGSFDLWPILAASGRRLYLSVAVQNSGMRLARTLPAQAARRR